MSCLEGNHDPVSGLLYVHEEDLDMVAEMRLANNSSPVYCNRCDAKYVWNELASKWEWQKN